MGKYFLFFIIFLIKITFVNAEIPPIINPINKTTKIRFKKKPFVNPNGDQVDDKMRITKKTTMKFPNQG